MPIEQALLFKACLAVVLEHEGGFVDNPRDPGGVTGAGGVTLRAVKLRDHDRNGHLDFDLDRDGDVDVNDMRALKANGPEVAELYRSDYWALPGGHTCAELGPALALAVFDCSINSGPRTSVALLQRALGGRVTEDGVLGAKTLAAIAPLAKRLVLRDYIAERGIFYARQEMRQVWGADGLFAKPHLLDWIQGKREPVFLRGWMRRLAAVQQECQRMAMDAHGDFAP